MMSLPVTRVSAHTSFDAEKGEISPGKLSIPLFSRRIYNVHSSVPDSAAQNVAPREIRCMARRHVTKHDFQLSAFPGVADETTCHPGKVGEFAFITGTENNWQLCR